MNYGIVEIDQSVLVSLLKMEGAIIHAVQWNPERRTFVVGMAHPEFGPISEGTPAPTYMPTYSVHYCGHRCDLGVHRAVTRDPMKAHGTTYEIPEGSNAEVNDA